MAPGGDYQRYLLLEIWNADKQKFLSPLLAKLSKQIAVIDGALSRSMVNRSKCSYDTHQPDIFKAMFKLLNQF
jgi:hypothetical protein